MKRFIFLFIASLLLVASCTREETLDTEQTFNCVALATRSVDIDSVILNSKLLNEIHTFNDSILTKLPYSPNTRSDNSTSNTPNLTPVNIADILGFGYGFWMAKKDGIDMAIILGTLVAAEASNRKAKEMAVSHNYPFSVTTVESFKYYENSYSKVLFNNYTYSYNSQLTTLGDMTKFSQFIDYFKVGIDHNLILYTYNNEQPNGNTVSSLFPTDLSNFIYSPQYQTQILGFIEDIVNENINYSMLFYNYDELTQTYSQYKAGEFLKAFSYVLTHHNATMESIKAITLEYLHRTNNTSELSPYEKNILLHTLPIAITSFKYWQNNINSIE